LQLLWHGITDGRYADTGYCSFSLKPAYAFYLFFVHLLGDTFSPSVIGKISDASNLRTALYLPVATNFLGAVFFLLTTKLMKNFKKE
jgi:hypothetical protein